MHFLLDTWRNGWKDKRMNRFQRPSWSPEEEIRVRLSSFPCRSSLMCGRGNQTNNRVKIKRGELIGESSESVEDEKGWVWERFFGQVGSVKTGDGRRWIPSIKPPVQPGEQRVLCWSLLLQFLTFHKCLPGSPIKSGIWFSGSILKEQPQISYFPFFHLGYKIYWFCALLPWEGGKNTAR